MKTLNLTHEKAKAEQDRWSITCAVRSTLVGQNGQALDQIAYLCKTNPHRMAYRVARVYQELIAGGHGGAAENFLALVKMRG